MPRAAGPTSNAPSPGEEVPAARRQRNLLSEDQIVEAALRVIQRDGLDALTMRRLSRELDVSAMAAYYYVGNKQKLLDMVAAQALAHITVPSSDLPWHTRLRILIDRVDAELRHYRGVEEVLLEGMLTSQRHVLRAIMEVLDDAGFDDAGIVKAYATVHTYLFGRSRVRLAGPPPAELVDASAGDGAQTAHRSHDIVERLQPTVAILRGRDYYEFGVDTVIAGLQAQLRKQRRLASHERTDDE